MAVTDCPTRALQRFVAQWRNIVQCGLVDAKVAPRAGLEHAGGERSEPARVLETGRGDQPPVAVGSSGWTRTSNPPVNRLMQVFILDGSSLVWPLMRPAVTWCSGGNCSRMFTPVASVWACGCRGSERTGSAVIAGATAGQAHAPGSRARHRSAGVGAGSARAAGRLRRLFPARRRQSAGRGRARLDAEPRRVGGRVEKRLVGQ
jgi:hypothetical protein